MARRQAAPTRLALDALAVLGAQIRIGRHDKNWTAADLATRVGVGPRTITAIERGAPGVAIGTVLSAASLVGVPLFGADGVELARLRRRGEERVALLPSREYPPRSTTADDDDDALNF
ncbi:helix-turn-helix transcriptional regulator [Millisia brevis]|uniref:helix-turn-helix transcriptional regulator n=1 Tax=Millisia brevis TaxID=264148 RepID=UPI000835C747|nr:helix-turn-helix domain-containing protein [Millisia brevis]